MRLNSGKNGSTGRHAENQSQREVETRLGTCGRGSYVYRRLFEACAQEKDSWQYKQSNDCDLAVLNDYTKVLDNDTYA